MTPEALIVASIGRDGCALLYGALTTGALSIEATPQLDGLPRVPAQLVLKAHIGGTAVRLHSLELHQHSNQPGDPQST